MRVRSLLVALFAASLLAPIAGAQDEATSSAPLLGIEQVKELPWGTPVYGFSTLDPSGPQKFTGRFLGVLRNTIGPGHHWYAIELQGEPFEHGGIVAGQSGSPLFVDVAGKPHKIGTLSYGNSWQLNPITYLTPIEEVIATSKYGSAPGSGGGAPGGAMSVGASLQRRMERREKLFNEFKDDSDVRLLRAMGSTSSGVTTGGKEYPIVAGSVLGVQLAWGKDFDYTGHGTVSHVDGDKIYMFGHPFLQLGPADYRLVRSRVLTVQRSYARSYIETAPIEGLAPVGVITQDREAGISGTLGKLPESPIPVTGSVTTLAGGTQSFEFFTSSDPTIGPILVGMGVDSVVMANTRSLGDVTIFLQGKVELTDGPTVEFNQAFFGDLGPYRIVREKVKAILDNRYSKAKIKHVSVDLRIFDDYRKLTIDSVTLDQPNLKPGENLKLRVTLSQPLKESKTITLEVPLPKDLKPGVGQILVGDNDTINSAESEGSSVVNLTTLVESLNEKRAPDAVYVYIVLPPSQAKPQKEDKPTPMQLGDITTEVRRISKSLSANVEEFQIPVKDFIVVGHSKLEFKVGTSGGGSPHH